MGNVDYTLYNKYSLSVSMRGDGSSMVGNDHTWGFFPSVSLSWDMKQEKWLRSLQKITMLKLRTGYGRSGNLGGISQERETDGKKPQVWSLPTIEEPSPRMETERLYLLYKV
jgi:hypothetical protein